MTTINLLTNDQTLIVLQKVKIASGDVNSVKVHVDFDSAWDEYTNRVANFSTSTSLGTHDIILTNNEATVPAEVLAESGTLRIGIWAATTDGSARKTSSVVSMKIVQGATPGETTLTPEKDLYQQYLEAMNSKIEPVVEGLKNDFSEIADEKIAEAEEELEGSNEAIIAGFLIGDLIWSNPNTSAIFPAQTVALDLSGYKRVKIIFIKTASSSPHIHIETECSVKGLLMMANGSDAASSRYRNFTVTNQGIEFNAGSQGDSVFVPYQIYGYKY